MSTRALYVPNKKTWLAGVVCFSHFYAFAPHD